MSLKSRVQKSLKLNDSASGYHIKWVKYADYQQLLSETQTSDYWETLVSLRNLSLAGQLWGVTICILFYFIFSVLCKLYILNAGQTF